MSSTFTSSFRDFKNTSSHCNDLSLSSPDLPSNDFANYLNWPESPTLPDYFHFARADTMTRSAGVEGSQHPRIDEDMITEYNGTDGKVSEPICNMAHFSRTIDINFVEQHERPAGAKIFSANWPIFNGKSIADGRRGAISRKVSDAPRRRRCGGFMQKHEIEEAIDTAMAGLTIDEDSDDHFHTSPLWSDSESGSEDSIVEDSGTSAKPSESNMMATGIEMGRPMRSGSPVKRKKESLKDRIDRIMLYGIDGRKELLWSKEVGYRGELKRVKSMESIEE